MNETREQIRALREAYLAGRVDEWYAIQNQVGYTPEIERDERFEARRLAADARYPLVEVRVEPDPEPECGIVWRCVDGVLEWAFSSYSARGDAVWGRTTWWPPTPARIRLWAELLEHPTTNADTSTGEEGT